MHHNNTPRSPRGFRAPLLIVALFVLLVSPVFGLAITCNYPFNSDIYIGDTISCTHDVAVSGINYNWVIAIGDQNGVLGAQTGNTPNPFVWTVTDTNRGTRPQLRVWAYSPNVQYVWNLAGTQRPALSVGFTQSADSGNAPVTITYISTSTGVPAISTYAWAFDDGGTANTAQASHTWTTSGTHTATLTVTNSFGTLSTSKTVQIGATPYTSFTKNVTSGYPPLAVRFISTSTGSPAITWYNWYLNGVEQFPSVSYPAFDATLRTVGTWTIKLRATNSLGYTEQTQTVTVGDPTPTANFVGSPLSGNVPHTVTLTSTSTVPSGAPPIALWLWQVKKPDGSYISSSALGTGSTATFTADQFGYYTVLHRATNSYATAEISKSLYLTAGLPPSPTPTPTGSWTPTPAPTPYITAVQTYATIAPISTGIGEIVNKTVYRDQITHSVIGNFTSPYINAVDGLGNSVESFGMTVVNFTTMPINMITPRIVSIVAIFTDITGVYATNARYLLLGVTMTIAAIPASVQGLITVKLIYDFLLVVIRGRYGN